MRISGTTPDSTYVEIVELPEHPYFIGCQFHPEFKSKPLEPHPLFREFIAASYKKKLAGTNEGLIDGAPVSVNGHPSERASA